MINVDASAVMNLAGVPELSILAVKLVVRIVFIWGVRITRHAAEG